MTDDERPSGTGLRARAEALGNAMVFDCPECGHDYRRHLGTKPGCKDCPGLAGTPHSYDHPGSCSHTMASALGTRIAEAAAHPDAAAGTGLGLSEVLAAHRYVGGDLGWICLCTWDTRTQTPQDAHRAHVAAELESVVAARVAEAEQRGREDNADHGMCYVHGSEALAARVAEAKAEQLAEDEAVRESDMAATWDEGAQAATDWIKSGAWLAMMPENPYRAARLAPDASPGGEG